MVTWNKMIGTQMDSDRFRTVRNPLLVALIALGVAITVSAGATSLLGFFERSRAITPQSTDVRAAA